ncbi:hypothetical protein QOT17_011524 [Balamuthia mandrillaris]
MRRLAVFLFVCAAFLVYLALVKRDLLPNRAMGRPSHQPEAHLGQDSGSGECEGLAPRLCSADQVRTALMRAGSVLAGASQQKFQQHSYTSRSLSTMMEVAPPFFVLSPEAWNFKDVSALDMGCGNGRSLLELQSILPQARTACVNKAGYGMMQSENPTDLLAVAMGTNTSVYCRGTTPILPEIRLTERGIALEDLPFPTASMDIILSQHALNQGKIQPEDLPVALRRIAKLLKPGGIAVLHVVHHPLHTGVFPADAPLIMHVQNNLFVPLRLVHTRRLLSSDVEIEAERFSILMYFTFERGGNTSSISLYIRRCGSSDMQWPSLTGLGCLLPPSAPSSDILTTAWVKEAKLASLKSVLLDEPLMRQHDTLIRSLNPNSGSWMRSFDTKQVINLWKFMDTL